MLITYIIDDIIPITPLPPCEKPVPSGLYFDVEIILASHPYDTDGGKEEGCRNRTHVRRFIDGEFGAEMRKCNDVGPQGDLVDGS